MVPKVWLPPATPFTLQLTALFSATVTVALNCAVEEVTTATDEGFTVTVMAGGATVVEAEELADAGAVPPQDVIKLTKPTAKPRTMAISNFRTFIPRLRNPEM